MRKRLPNATTVFDKFHVVQKGTQAVDDVRREAQRESDAAGKRTIFGTRRLLLRSKANLEKEEDKDRLNKRLELNEPISKGHLLKEEMLQFWSQASKKAADEYINRWLVDARASGLKPMAKLAKTIDSQKYGILAYYDYPITSGIIEGVNNKIKALVRKGYGYRNKRTFMLLIYAVRDISAYRL